MSRRFFDAVRSFRYQQIRMLLNRGVDVDVKNSKGQTALMIVCSMSHVEASKRLQMFRYLIKSKAEPLEVDSNLKSVFHYACEAGDDPIMRIILRMYNSNAVDHVGKDRDGRTAMHFAVKSGNLTTVKLVYKLFTERFISLDIPDNCGVTPLIEARKLGFEELAAFLVVTGRANPHICDTTYHRNSEEWAKIATKRKRQRTIAALRVRREKQLIYPRGRIKMRKIPSLVDLKFGNTNQSHSHTSVVADGRFVPSRTSSLSLRDEDCCEEVKDYSVRQSKGVKALDISLLQLSSKMKARRQHLTSFVAEDTAQSQTNFVGQRLPAMFNVYSQQLSASYCRDARQTSTDEQFDPKVKGKKPRGGKTSNLSQVLRNGKDGPSQKWNVHGFQRAKHVNRLSNNKLTTARGAGGSLGKLVVLPGIRVVEATEDDVAMQ